MDYEEKDNEFENNIEEVDLTNTRCDIGWVKEFNPEKITENAFIIIAAKRRSGKTHLTRHLIKPIAKRFSKAYLFSETSYLQDNPYDFVPRCNQYDGFKPDVINEILNKQKQIILSQKQLPEKRRKRNKVLLIFDDVIADPLVRSSPILKLLAIEARHADMTCVILSQSIAVRDNLKTIVLTNADIFIAFTLHDQRSRETAAERYLSIKGKKEGMVLLNSITTSAPYTAIVCDMSNPMIKDYKDYVYKMKCPNTKPKFKIGNEEEINKKEFTVEGPKKMSYYGYTNVDIPLRFKQIKFNCVGSKKT